MDSRWGRVLGACRGTLLMECGGWIPEAVARRWTRDVAQVTCRGCLRVMTREVEQALRRG